MAKFLGTQGADNTLTLNEEARQRAAMLIPYGHILLAAKADVLVAEEEEPLPLVDV